MSEEDDLVLENDPFENDPVLAKAEPPLVLDLDGQRVALGKVSAIEKQDELTTRFDLSIVKSDSKSHPLILDVEIDERDLEEDDDPCPVLRLHLTQKSGEKLRSLLDQVLPSRKKAT